MNDLIKQSGSAAQVSTAQDNPYIERATAYLDLLGGESNINDLISCSTRVRAHVVDMSKVANDVDFKKYDAKEVERKDNEKKLTL